MTPYLGTNYPLWKKLFCVNQQKITMHPLKTEIKTRGQKNNLTPIVINSTTAPYLSDLIQV